MNYPSSGPVTEKIADCIPEKALTHWNPSNRSSNRLSAFVTAKTAASYVAIMGLFMQRRAERRSDESCSIE